MSDTQEKCVHEATFGDVAGLRRAIEDLFAQGCISRPDRVDVCLPCINDAGYSPSNEWCTRCESEVKEKCKAIYNAKHAIEAPARNCDVGTLEEQRARLEDFCDKRTGRDTLGRSYCCENCPYIDDKDCGLTWANAPYQENGKRD